MRRRVGAILLGLAMSLTLMSAQALAISPEQDTADFPPVKTVKMEPRYVEGSECSDNHDELFERYVMELLGIAPDSGASPVEEGFAGSAWSGLDAEEKDLYNVLKVMIQELMDGTRDSAEFHFDRCYPAAARIESIDRVILALRMDYPAAFFWYGHSYWLYSYDYSPEYAGTALWLQVAEPYRPEGGEPYDFNHAVLDQVNAALRNAQEIVSKNARKSDYEKLRAYLDRLCRLVKYDYDAIDGTDISYVIQNPGPWSLVNAFDGDPNTNIVCEGYAKAFQYLCDRTDWEGDVKCYLVNGDLGGPVSHMWNIVRIDGASYLADITNCDYTYNPNDGGADLSERGLEYTDRLFLVGGEPEGPNTYVVTQVEWVLPGADWFFYECQTRFNYSEETRTIYPDNILNLSPTSYRDASADPDQSLKGTVSISGDAAVGGILTADISNLDSPAFSRLSYNWKVDGVTTSDASSYTVKASDAGKPISVTVTAQGYTGSVTSAPVTAGDGKTHGKVSVKEAGETRGLIQVTLMPDPGYKAGPLTVTEDVSGRTVPVTGSENFYTFSMPAADVTINVKFVRQ